MFKRRIFRPREEPPRPRSHGASKARPRQQFMRQINEDEFEMLLVQQPPPAKKSVQAPQQELGFVFHPMAASTPRRNNRPSSHSLASTMPELIDDPEDSHRLGARLTMSQFIGELPSKKHKADDADEIAVKLPKYIDDQSNDFETILVDDFTDGGSPPPGVDLNSTEDILKIIYGEDYNTTDDLGQAFEFLNDERRPVSDAPFAINDSTRCIFKDLLRDANPRADSRGFKKPNPRHVRKPKSGIPDFLREQLPQQPKRRRMLDGLQLRKELKNLYEFLKVLFDGGQ